MRMTTAMVSSPRNNKTKFVFEEVNLHVEAPSGLLLSPRNAEFAGLEAAPWPVYQLAVSGSRQCPIAAALQGQVDPKVEKTNSAAPQSLGQSAVTAPYKNPGSR